MATLLSPLPRLYKVPRGVLYAALFDANGDPASTGFIDLGNPKLAQYTNKPTFDFMKSNRGGPSTVAAAAAYELDGEIEIEGTEFSAENLAIMYGGTVSTFTQSGATVTGETPIGATPSGSIVLGALYQTKQRNISAVGVKAGATALLGPGPNSTSDFEVINALTGLIHIYEVPTSVGLTGAITVSYTSAAITGLDQVSPGTVSGIGASLLFVPSNPGGTINQEIFLYSVLFLPDTGPEFISEKGYATWKVKAKVLNDFATGGTHGGTSALPFGYILNQTAT
jgi:hypothetical protein